MLVEFPSLYLKHFMLAYTRGCQPGAFCFTRGIGMLTMVVQAQDLFVVINCL